MLESIEWDHLDTATSDNEFCQDFQYPSQENNKKPKKN